MHLLHSLIQTLVLACSLRTAGDAPLADRFTETELDSAGVPHERVLLPIETELIAPVGSAAEATEPRSRTRFGSVCYAYLKENGIYVRRFAVHAPDAEALPLARNAARFLSIIWGAANQRLGTLSHRLRAAAVDVWLTRAGQAGGEQIGSSIYLYDVDADRIPIEWARELAHEYGHYLLPGASGYVDPESWSNGLLGERLFLRWLREDLRTNRVKPDMLPFVKPSDIDDYCEKQPEPLIDRIRRRGPDLTILRRRDAPAMDEFSALLLFADATYGSRCLVDLLDYLPDRPVGGTNAEDFLSALSRFISNAPRFSSRVSAGAPMRLLVPKGAYRVTSESPVAHVSLDRGSVTPEAANRWLVTVTDTGWHTLTLQSRTAALLQWVRR